MSIDALGVVAISLKVLRTREVDTQGAACANWHRDTRLGR
jgi:hypothetical protein